MKSIFDLEIRTDYVLEYETVKELVYNEEVQNIGRYQSLEEVIIDNFRDWPLRKSAIDPYGFFKRRNILTLDHEYPIKEDVLYFYDFIINQIFYIHRNENIRISEDFRAHMIIIVENIKIALEYLNCRIKEKNNGLFIITKRDADVDSVLESVPELSDALLSYLDFKIKDDLGEKKKLLLTIYLYIEDKKAIYRGLADGKGLYDEIKLNINTHRIKHKGKINGFEEQVTYLDEELLLAYDSIFKMMIHLIRIPEINEIKKNIKINRIENLGR